MRRSYPVHGSLFLLAGFLTWAGAAAIAQMPQITEHPASLAVCEDDDALFWVEATGPDLQYQWRKGGYNISGATSDTYHIVQVLPSHAGNYDVVVTNSFGSVTSTAATLTVDSGPIITTQPQPASGCVGTPATLHVAATSTIGALHYQWYKDDLPIAGATQDTLSYSSPTVTDSGSYYVVVTNDCYSTTSATALLWVDNGPEIVEQPQGATLCEGDPYTLEVTLSNLVTTRQDVVGSTTNVGTGPRLRGNYYRATKNIRLTRIEQYLKITTPGPLVFYVYEAVAQAGPYELVVEDTIASAGPGTGYYASNTLNYPLESGKYYIFGAGWSGSHTFYWNTTHGAKSFGVSLKGFQVAWQSPLPNPAPSSNTTSAYMQRITTSDTALSYQWRKDDADIPGATGTQYTISAMSAEHAGEYSVFIENDCGEQLSDYALVEILQPATISQQPQGLYVCNGGEALFSVQAAGTGLTYQWLKDGEEIEGATASTYEIAAVTPDDAGYYSVVIDNGCPVTSGSARLIVLSAAPTIAHQPQSLDRCVGQSATFTVSVSGIPEQYSFQWHKDGTAISGATNASYTISQTVLASAGAYHAVVTNACGSTESQVATLGVDEALTIVTQPRGPEDDELCEGNDWELSVVTTGTNVSYQWKKNGVDLPGATDSVYLISAADPNDAGAYAVDVENDCGALTSASVTIRVVSYPAILRQPRDVDTRPGQSFTLEVGLDLQTLNADVDEIGTRGTGLTGDNRQRGNVYAVVQTTTLTKIEHYMNFPTSGPIRFFVYESQSGSSGPYNLILNDYIAASGTGARYYSSNPIEVRLVAGRHYLIGAAWTASCTYYRMDDPYVVWPTAFGYHVIGYGTAYTGTLAAHPVPSQQNTIWPQRLTTVKTKGYCQWRKDNEEIPGADTEVYHVTSAVPADAGRYDVVITNACGAVTSNSAHVNMATIESDPAGMQAAQAEEGIAP